MLHRAPAFDIQGRAASSRSPVLRTGRRHLVSRIISRIAQDEFVQTESLEAPLSAGVSEEEHPSLPFIPAFKVGDIVYATSMFANDRGTRTDIMYHQGLVG